RAIQWALDSERATIPGFVPVAHPAVAEHMLGLLPSRSLRQAALDWLNRHPIYAARAWVPTAVGRDGKARQAAEAGLRELVAEGHVDEVREAARHYGPAAEASIEALLARDPLTVLPGKPPKTLFVAAAVLPRPRLRDRQEVLPLEAIDAVLTTLALCTADRAYAGVDVLKATLDADSLADFGWAVFEQWLAMGAPTKEAWGFTQLGYVGNDRVAGLLTPMIRRWPGESQHKRAVTGLDVLLAIGTDVALMHLNGIAQKVKFKGIKEAAQERIQRLAESLELTTDQLADRLVPDLGLDADGTLTLDYGPRQFVVGFDEALKPYVKDAADGKRRTALPKPGAKDDPALAGPAEETFKQLKKDVRTLAGLQILRLEQAMITCRRWPAADFERFLVAHPLLVHLVRRLIWGVYGADGALTATFRVAEDGTYADRDDEGWELPAGAQVGVVHPIDMQDADRAGWGEVLADYELLQPFPQLGRPVFHLTDAERGATALERNPAKRIPIGRMLGLFSKGWVRGEAQDAGVSHWVTMPLPDGRNQIRMNLGEAGIWTGMGAQQDEDPTVEKVVVCDRNAWDWNPKGDVAWGSLPAGLVSEVLATLDQLHAD
ncbi:MAG: DUF4132 domain-containing protein, partial [Myxococcales bacterium]|nr:DUF4132 domain-containing protein [Myxococcales bacterium]